MYSINNIPFSNYGILPSNVQGEGIAMKGIFDLPKRIGDTEYAWADEDSVEPYVDADEIFFDARALEFSGIVQGTKIEAEENLASFKALIATFTDLVLLVTPYGSFSVYVNYIQAFAFDGVTRINIFFSEPFIGLEVPELEEEETVYYSAAYSETAVKNNCSSGFTGSTVTFTASAGLFTSILSQAAADQLAIDWVRENKQDFANNNGTCTANPVTYWNDKQTGTLMRNNCGAGFTGSIVTYVVEAFSFSSKISKEDANAKALQELSIKLTQEYANANGRCTLNRLFYLTEEKVIIFTTTFGQERYFYKSYFVDPSFPVGTTFWIQIYGVRKSYTTVPGDTATIVINALVSAINATTNEQWNEFYQAPVFTGIIKKPEAGITVPPIPNLFPQFFTPQLFLKIYDEGGSYAINGFEIP